MIQVNVTDAAIAEWTAGGHKYKVIAAHIAEWARKSPADCAGARHCSDRAGGTTGEIANC